MRVFLIFPSRYHQTARSVVVDLVYRIFDAVVLQRLNDFVHILMRRDQDHIVCILLPQDLPVQHRIADTDLQMKIISNLNPYIGHDSETVSAFEKNICGF